MVSSRLVYLSYLSCLSTMEVKLVPDSPLQQTETDRRKTELRLMEMVVMTHKSKAFKRLQSLEVTIVILPKAHGHRWTEKHLQTQQQLG